MGKDSGIEKAIDELAKLVGHADLFAAQVRVWRRGVVGLIKPEELVDQDCDPRKMIVSAKLIAFQAYCKISASMGFMFGKDQPEIPLGQDTGTPT